MKKFLLLIVTLAYFTSTSGATIYFHQCMGKTIGWDVIEDGGNNCTNCGMHKNAPQDCCQEHVKVLKVHNDQVIPNTGFQKTFLPQVILPFTRQSVSAEFFQPATRATDKYIFRRSSTINYCILFCTFLI